MEKHNLRPFSLLIKPASADCNLRCGYCFYLDRLSLYPESAKHRMDDKTLDKMVSSFMQTPQEQYSFGWQGGEPTLMGLDFFKRVVELQKKYGRQGAVVSNGLQTNGILINTEFAKFLKEYSFLVGTSLDGPEEIHNHFRKFGDGRGTQAEVMKGIACMKQEQVEYNILSLVSTANVEHADTIYSFYRENGFNYLQFIPCVEFDDANQPLPFTITARQWGEFMCRIFDLWYKHDRRKVSIRLFDSIMVYLVDGVRNICHIGRNCCQYFVVEHNGDIYPCDFFVRKDLKLGNIHENSWEELQNSELYKQFGGQKPQWQNKCQHCEFLDICSGDCLKHRIYGNITTPQNLSWLCEGWEMFFRHTMPRFRKIAAEIKQERQREQLIRQIRSNPALINSIPKNSPCPCGSGKKFRKCCLTLF